MVIFEKITDCFNTNKLVKVSLKKWYKYSCLPYTLDLHHVYKETSKDAILIKRSFYFNIFKYNYNVFVANN